MSKNITPPKNNFTYVGVDVSKNHLDVALAGSNKSQRFKNTPEGCQQLINSFTKKGRISLVILEASGGYESTLLRDLEGKKIAFRQVNPKRARDFAKACGV